MYKLRQFEKENARAARSWPERAGPQAPRALERELTALPDISPTCGGLVQ